MKKYIITSITAILLTLTAVAQSDDENQAREILDKISAKTKNYVTIEVDFLFTLENLQAKITDDYSGNLVLKGNKYRASIMGVDNFFDGETMWMLMEDANEVNISNADDMEEDMLNPSNIFTIYKQGFKMSYVGETVLNGKRVDLIDLFPENRDKPFSKIKLYIYKDSLQFAKVEQIGRDGTNYIIDIMNMNVNKNYDDSYFVFDPSKYPGIEIIDLR